MDKLPEWSKFFGEIWENNSHVYDIRIVDGVLYQTKCHSLELAANMPLSECSIDFMEHLDENPNKMFRICERFCFDSMRKCNNRQ